LAAGEGVPVRSLGVAGADGRTGVGRRSAACGWLAAACGGASVVAARNCWRPSQYLPIGKPIAATTTTPMTAMPTGRVRFALEGGTESTGRGARRAGFDTEESSRIADVSAASLVDSLFAASDWSASGCCAATAGASTGALTRTAGATSTKGGTVGASGGAFGEVADGVASVAGATSVALSSSE
jgi:hypothetical protein